MVVCFQSPDRWLDANRGICQESLYSIFMRLILHLELILSGREHIMGTVASHVTHTEDFKRAEDVITVHCWLVDSYLQGCPEKKNHTTMFVFWSLYIWLSLRHKRHKSGWALSFWRMRVCNSSEPPSSLMMVLVERMSWSKQPFIATQRLEIIAKANR